MRGAFAAFTFAAAVAAGGTLAGLGLAGSHAEDDALVARAVAPELACDDCEGTPPPSPTVTFTATASATKTPSPKASPTPSPKPSPTPSPSPGFSPAPEQTPPPSPTVFVPQCEDADAHIVSFDRGTQTLRIEGHGSLGMTGNAEMGWWLRNENSFQRYYFKPGFILDGYVEVVGEIFTDTATRVSAQELFVDMSFPASFTIYDCRSQPRGSTFFETP